MNCETCGHEDQFHVDSTSNDPYYPTACTIKVAEDELCPCYKFVGAKK